MRFLCLIHLNEQEMAALPHAMMNDLNVRHLALNDNLRASGNLVEASALESSETAVRLQLRGDRKSVVDGPFAETKELVAGFYLIDARDMQEAIGIASRFPSAPYGTVEIWPTRQLEVDGGPA
ncbi:MAG: YciI family protein [Gemmatimonadaceae bacterium]|nr:YciI family protein [Gemmatimonadaceae bacterium]